MIGRIGYGSIIRGRDWWLDDMDFVLYYRIIGIIIGDGWIILGDFSIMGAIEWRL